MTKTGKDTKRTFFRKGTCSQAFFFLLDREFDHENAAWERAADPLAGGVMQSGGQCGLLTGSTLAAGAEAYRRFGGGAKGRGMAILAARRINESFSKRSGSPDCRDITGLDFSSKVQRARFLVFKSYSCYKLAERWAPEAVQAAEEGLSGSGEDLPEGLDACCCALAKMKGASEEETTIVAGLSGGLGLSGNVCGALIAAMWLNSLEWSRMHPEKETHTNDYASNAFISFHDATGMKCLCSEIAGRRFNTIKEHSEFIRNGGCRDLIAALAKT